MEVSGVLLDRARRGRAAAVSKTIEEDFMIQWFRDIWDAVSTVAAGMLVTLRYWFKTYEPERGTFTQKFEYPELPIAVAPRYRGFHRYDLTTCIACDQCA